MSPTRTVGSESDPAPAHPPVGGSARAHPRGSSDRDRFLPGALLAGRYRMIGLLGRGGAGEVYRADDLKLGQTVALKFLPAAFAQDEARLQRLLGEVRIARQVSHPNVCRVYDAGEADGHHFISMEYVDGEDLASLLRRIGRLPKDKAVQLARQLCAGLAAAHEQGVLHRDLKPANVMIDGRGRARIADFGLAVLAGALEGDEAAAGTPVYMAPEQISTKSVTVRSDIYSLGLVLYELFTGQPGFKASTLADLLRLKTESTPADPSSLVEGIDPAVERTILRCLERDPRDRPSSATMVAASLPGGDPLAAAVAAGETPSPELVAAAGQVGGLRPAAALACIAIIIVGVALTIASSRLTQLSQVVPLPKPPDVLAERAREITKKLGHTATPLDGAHAFQYSRETVALAVENARPAEAWERLGQGPPYAIVFWYRQGPEALIPFLPRSVTYDDPPSVAPSSIRIQLEPDGRLRQFEAVPPEHDDSKGPWPDPSWGRCFEEAGLDPTTFTPVEPEWSPPVYADTRAAWTGSFPGAPETSIRVEAASFHGTLVSFRIVGPWAKTAVVARSPVTPGARIGRLMSVLFAIGVAVGGVLLARRNLRLGRCDRRSATALAMVMLFAGCTAWVLRAHHVSDTAEIGLALRGLAFPGFFSGLTWIGYLALEPYVRRLWPQVLVSWVRILSGRFNDPLVGRDVLIGFVAGLAFVLLSQGWVLGSRWLGWPIPRLDAPPYWVEFEDLSGFRFGVANLLELFVAQIFFNVIAIVMLLLSRVILRRQWPAILVTFIVTTLPSALTSQSPYATFLFSALGAALMLFILLRLGLLALIVSNYVSMILTVYPLTFDFSRWYAGNTLLVLIVAGGLAAYAFRVSLAGRPIFRDAVLQD